MMVATDPPEAPCSEEHIVPAQGAASADSGIRGGPAGAGAVGGGPHVPVHRKLLPLAGGCPVHHVQWRHQRGAHIWRGFRAELGPASAAAMPMPLPQ